MHFCVMLWGFTAIIGRVVELEALPLVWWRMTLVAGILLGVPAFWRGVGRLTPRMAAIYGMIGVIVALHWLAFYSSVKLSNASVAATCMALGPVFLSLVEPVIVGTRFQWRELVFGASVVPGILLVVGGTPVLMRDGILAGIAAALLVALFSSLNKKYVEHGGALAVTGLEMGAGAVFLFILAPAIGSGSFPPIPSHGDAGLIAILAVACTLVPYALALVALRHLSAFTSTLAVNMEPIYAIVLAIALLGEQRDLTPLFYVGVALILLVVFAHPILERRGGFVAPETEVVADGVRIPEP
jgi:drug/metabolite transporter (DMT)-like permease